MLLFRKPTEIIEKIRNSEAIVGLRNLILLLHKVGPIPANNWKSWLE